MELKLFTTPEEEMELHLLRQNVSKLYALAFKRIGLVSHNDRNTVALEVLDICESTMMQADELAQHHLEKWKI